MRDPARQVEAKGQIRPWKDGVEQGLKCFQGTREVFIKLDAIRPVFP